MRWFAFIALGASTVSAPQSAPAQSRMTMVAQCGASAGQAYYLAPTEAQGWGADKFSTGQLVFSVDARGKLRMSFRDSRGTKDTEADGGELIVSRLDRRLGELELVVLYRRDGIMQTYSVHRLDNGKHRLLWTTNATRAGGVISKAGAYVAECL